VLLEELFFWVFKVKDTVPHYWSPGEEHIEALIEKIIIDSCSREDTVKAKEKHRKHKEDILVEHVADQVAIPSVSFSSMKKQQTFKEFELSDCVVT